MAQTRESLSDLGSQYALIAKIIEDVRRLHSISPGKAADLMSELSSNLRGADAGSASKAEPKRTSSAFELIKEVYLRDNNPWLTRAQIQDLAGVNENASHNIIYKPKYSSFFESRPDPDGGRAKQFRLEAKALASLRKGGGD